MGKWVKDKVGLSVWDRGEKSQLSLVRLKSLLNHVAVWEGLSTISLLAEEWERVIQTWCGSPDPSHKAVRWHPPHCTEWIMYCFVEELFLWIQCRVFFFFFLPLHSTAHGHSQACARVHGHTSCDFVTMPQPVRYMCLCTFKNQQNIQFSWMFVSKNLDAYPLHLVPLFSVTFTPSYSLTQQTGRCIP